MYLDIVCSLFVLLCPLVHIVENDTSDTELLYREFSFDRKGFHTYARGR